MEASDTEVNNIVSLSWEFLSLEYPTIPPFVQREENCELWCMCGTRGAYGEDKSQQK